MGSPTRTRKEFTTTPTTESPPTIAAGWIATDIGHGTKPSLALDTEGLPAVAFLFESASEGFVSYASAADAWAIERVVEGYFYGPIGLDFDPAGIPHIAYHDHQNPRFDPKLGDLTHAVLTADGWETSPAHDDGHDGWDSTIRIGSDGVVRAAGVDPSQFGSLDGVEYYELIDGVWTVESIGSGPVEYEWNVDLQIADDGTLGISYLQSTDLDLMFASRKPGGSWQIETVAAGGDVGRFSSLAFDQGGSAHISYWNADTSMVEYATNASGGWTTSEVAGLGGVEIDMEGARRITSLAFDSNGAPAIAYSDTTGIWIARQASDDTWHSENVITAGSNPLGQLVSLAIDQADQPHLAFTEITGHRPLTGNITYATTG